MSLLSRILGIGGKKKADEFTLPDRPLVPSHYAVIDAEVSLRDKKVHDIGAWRHDGATFHRASKRELVDFLAEGGVDFVCGHNIVHHDAKYLFGEEEDRWVLVDTLYVSPLLFPERPYHKLLKDDKLETEQLNNPLNDSLKARDLLLDELAVWRGLPSVRRMILSGLLCHKREFAGFIRMAGYEEPSAPLAELIREEYHDEICINADLETLTADYPCETAYALALTGTSDHHSVTPGWVLHNYSNVEYVMRQLRHHRCAEGCPYCSSQLDIRRNLKLFFGYDHFRTYDGEPLQEKAVQAASDGESLLAIFPTGGGKSLTFQLPALMEGRSEHGLTVVISPLQSLMKDQVDNLAGRGITDAVAINGLLDPITRSECIRRVMNGDVSLLYIAPEMLRSKTIERILTVRHVVRFVIDEAHCFSSWGQDFRVDYLYIGTFIRKYQEQKRVKTPVPVSCFTATAKQKVIQDICDYFDKELGLKLSLFASSASRTNLRYSVIHSDTDEEKYSLMRALIAENHCPTIVYVSRTRRTVEIADSLCRDGFRALPFNGGMKADDKIANQEAFMSDRVQIIVATSAFGMGVDKKDVGLVIHYDISDSLENYVQEAGRAGRDPHLDAKCYVLYSDSDLDKHFILLNQTKLSISEIQQVWTAVKRLTRQRKSVDSSALEIARTAGWDDSVSDIETRVRTALAALERAGYIERGNNVPHVYATGITVKNMDEARKRITESRLFDDDEAKNAILIIKSLISQKYVTQAQGEEAESRIDYLADILGYSKREVVSAVERMKQEGILADCKDISAYLQDSGGTVRRPRQTLERFARLERYLLQRLTEKNLHISGKQLNEDAVNAGVTDATEKDIRTLLYFLVTRGYTRKHEDAAHDINVECIMQAEAVMLRYDKRIEVCSFIIDWLYNAAAEMPNAKENTSGAIRFSVVELLNAYNGREQSLFSSARELVLEDVEESLLYMQRIGALKLEGGFLVIYNAMNIRRIKEPKYRYKLEDYRMLDKFYKQKIQQIHIVGEYANLMVKDYDAALRYVGDYFHMDYKAFIGKYFKGDRVKEISRNITPRKYVEMFQSLSAKQMEIISDKESRCIVVAAGPGSGKTRVLVHKLASLLLLEDVKHEQLLMLTFSRAAATEFKQRLIDLIGNAAHFVDIKTFHSYCLDLLGRVGSSETVGTAVRKAAEMIRQGEVEPSRIGKTVLVIDEAQDMGQDDYDLVSAMMNNNEDMRVIAVGDDDQNIYEFRGSDSEYMRRLCSEHHGRFMEMTENYRSTQHVVRAANAFVQRIRQRMKSAPIISMSHEEGSVSVTHHVSPYMYEPIVQEMLHHRHSGTSCVLTQTNDEALNMVALLHRHGIEAQLIQSLDGFRFCNLAEIKHFCKHLDSGRKSPVITTQQWEEAKRKTFSRYAASQCLPCVKRCISLFEQTNRTMYYNDFREYLFESSIEDFCDTGSGGGVVVSTIHKAKGREYDNVYMLINNRYPVTDVQLRRYYVAITRAKSFLSVHTNDSTFDGIGADRFLADGRQYPMPEEVVVQTSMKDINLRYLSDHKRDILMLQGGDALAYSDNALFVSGTTAPVAFLSRKMQQDLQQWRSKGYEVGGTSVRFIVAWKPKDAPKGTAEVAVPLVDFVLKKVKA